MTKSCYFAMFCKEASDVNLSVSVYSIYGVSCPLGYVCSCVITLHPQLATNHTFIGATASKGVTNSSN